MIAKMTDGNLKVTILKQIGYFEQRNNKGHKQIPKYILTDDKNDFGAQYIIRSVSQSLNFGPQWQFS